MIKRDLKVGDEVLCIKPVYFLDKGKHVTGARLTVGKGEVAYYNLFLGTNYMKTQKRLELAA